MSDAPIKENEEVILVRLLVQEAMLSVIEKCNVANLRIDQLNDDMRRNTVKVEEIDILMRRLTRFNWNFEELWRQVQELESFRNVMEARRKQDMKEIIYKIKDSNKAAQLEIESFKIGMNKMDMILTQYKELLQDIILYKQSVNETIYNTGKTVTDANNTLTNEITNLHTKISNIECKHAKYIHLQNELNNTSKSVKGINVN